MRVVKADQNIYFNSKQFHIILTSISITIMWLGIVTSLGNAGRGVVNCNKLVLKSDLNTKCSDHQNVLVHFFLGIVTVTAFHLSALSGWTRPKHSKGVYMTSHSFAGYFTFFGAGEHRRICYAKYNKDVF